MENIGVLLIYTLLKMSKMDGEFMNYVTEYYLLLVVPFSICCIYVSMFESQTRTLSQGNCMSETPT